MAIEHFSTLKQHLSAQIIGQPAFVENLLIALLANGHLIVEGPPGLAKTRKRLSRWVGSRLSSHSIYTRFITG